MTLGRWYQPYAASMGVQVLTKKFLDLVHP